MEEYNHYKNALDQLVTMKNPSISSILRSHGYKYEADVIEIIEKGE